MSRIGNNPIAIPNGVSIDIKEPLVKISGARDALKFNLPSGIKISIDDSVLTDLRAKNDARHRSLHGTVRQILNNMIIGVTLGFKKTLVLHGLGYKVSIKDQILAFSIGFSHIVYKRIPLELL